MSRRTFNKKLRVERLEAKTLLAGDVSAAVIGGNLFIFGDEEANVLQLRQGATPDEFTLQERGGGSINGGDLNEVHAFPGVTGDVFVHLKGGDDVFRAVDNTGELLLPDDFLVWGGDGNDALILGVEEDDDFSSTFASVDDVVFYGGDGDDTLELRDSEIGGDLAFDGHHGNDFFLIRADSQIGPSSVADDVLIDGGHDMDMVIVGLVSIGDNLGISTGSEDDFVSVFSTVVGDSALVSLGSGNNAAEFFTVDVGNTLTVVGGGGVDSVLMDDTTAHTAIVSTHAGDDIVAILNQSEFEILIVSLGNGDDSLTIDGADIGFAVLSGGRGQDALVVSNSTIDFAWYSSFEV